MSPAAWKPADNHLLVAVPERFVSAAVPGKQRLFLPSGSDDWGALTDDLKAGRNADIETEEAIPQVPVRQGLVLATPTRLTADMGLCVGPWMKQVARQRVVKDKQGKPVKRHDGTPVLVSDGYADGNVLRTCADITEAVAVGDTIHFDHTCLTDEAEVSPGVYLVPYSAVICRTELACDPWRGEIPLAPHPIGGYLLLSRVWAADVEDATIEGRPRKVRYAKQSVPGNAGEWLRDVTGERIPVELDVPPLPNEGIVAWVGAPLRGTTDTLQGGQHVVFHGYRAHSDKSRPLDTGHALVEEIAGTEYLCVRQDYVLAVREPKLDFSKAPNLDADGLMKAWADDLEATAAHIRKNATRTLTYGGKYVGYPHIPNPAPCYDA